MKFAQLISNIIPIQFVILLMPKHYQDHWSNKVVLDGLGRCYTQQGSSLLSSNVAALANFLKKQLLRYQTMPCIIFQIRLCNQFFIKNLFFLWRINSILSFLSKIQMLRVVALLSLVLHALAQASTFSCMYTRTPPNHAERFSYFTTGGYHTGSSSVSLSWLGTQSGIINASFILTSWSINANYMPSFTASLSSISAIDALFNLNIAANSRIGFIDFQVILLKSCSGKIQLQLFDYTPTLLNEPFPSTITEFVSVNVATPFGSDTSRYIYEALPAFFLVTYTLILPIQLSIYPWSIIAGQNYQTVRLSSRYGNYQRVCFNYILIDLWSFNQTISYYTSIVSTSTFPSYYNNLNIPSQSNPNAVSQCLIGLRYIYSLYLNSATSIDVINTGSTSNTNFSSITGTNFQYVDYSIFCIQECPYSYVDYSTSKYICNPCSSISNCLTCVSASNCTRCLANYFNNINGYLKNLPDYTCTLCSLAIENCSSCISSILCLGCVANYFLLSYGNSSTCQLTCPMSYWADNVSSKCVKCCTDCLICLNSYSCLKCSTGKPVQGGCSNVYGCSKVSANQNTGLVQCTACYTNLFFVFSNGVCLCQSGYFMVTQLCTNDRGCIAVAQINNTAVCRYCNKFLNFYLNGSKCECLHGYFLDNFACVQICGDGLLFNLECDDGNNIDNDGCSSSCKIEKNFRCVKTPSNISQCTYMRKDISLSLKSIDKVDLVDQGIFTFSLTPYLYNLQRLDLSTHLAFQCNQAIQVTYAKISQLQLIVYVNFFEDLEGNEANITLTLGRNEFLQNQLSLNFSMISDGKKLNITQNESRLKACNTILISFSTIVLAVFFISLFSHKMIGIELIHSYQIIYFFYLISRGNTQSYGLLRWFSLTAFDLMYILNGFANIPTSQQYIVFNSRNQEFTLEVIVFASLFFLVIFLLFWIKLLRELPPEQAKHPAALRSLKIGASLKYAYHHFLFPFTMATLILSLLIVSTKHHYPPTFYVNCLCLFQIVLLSVVYFHELKVLFLAHTSQSEYVGVPKCRREYLPIYLLSIFGLSIVSCVCYTSEYNAQPFIAGLFLVFIFAILKYRPYRSLLHNFGVIMNLATVGYFFVWSALKNFDMISQSEDSEILFLFIFFLLISASILTSLFRIVHEIKLKWKAQSNLSKAETKGDEKKVKWEKADPNFEQASEQKKFMTKIERENLERCNEIDMNLFVPQPKRAKKSTKEEEILKRYIKGLLKPRYDRKEGDDTLL